MTKVIVFGGSGFIGSHVADELSEKGYDVTIFDIRESPFLRKGQKMIVGSILDLDQVRRATENHDVVYNFAGLADINEAKDKPLLTAELNIIGHIHCLEAARMARAKRFVYASTVYVYSESGSFYRVSKQTGEKYVELYREKYGLPFTILRYGSLYGSRSDHRNAIYRFIKSALTKGEIRYQGSGEELREYIHVIDAARASVGIMADEYANQHFIVTGHQQLRVKDVMLMVKEIIKNREVLLAFEGEDVEAHYNITPYAYKPRLGKKLVPSPFVDMGQGILECIYQVESEIRMRRSEA
jgi:UDP-glucose 4-epimerase